MDYTEACVAWHDWVHNGTLPETLHSHYEKIPPILPPAFDDPVIAGRHRPADNVSGATGNPAVTVNLHATATVQPQQQGPVTPSRTQHQPATSTPSRFYETSASASTSQTQAVAETELAEDSDSEEATHWVVISGVKPGVYGD